MIQFWFFHHCRGGGRRWGGLFSRHPPLFPDQARAVSLDLIFATPLISESRAWFRKQWNTSKIWMGKGRVGFFCSSNNPLEESVSKICSLFEMRKHGDKPFPPPLHPRSPARLFAISLSVSLVPRYSKYVHSLLPTGPYKTHHILCRNWNALGSEAIFHSRVGLHNVASLSHSSNVVNVAILEF